MSKNSEKSQQPNGTDLFRRNGLLLVGVVRLNRIGVVIALAVTCACCSRSVRCEADEPVVSFRHVLNLASASAASSNRSIREIDRGWHPGTSVMLLEVLAFTRSRRTFRQTIALLQRKTGQQTGPQIDVWYRWLWRRSYEPHPQYARFKDELYAGIDPRFSQYFQHTGNARIRLDEILWGGVKRDGIPPLTNPQMLRANRATYLADSDVVFGVILNGDARCYPKRILAWHEMFKDTIGGIPVCGAY